MSRLLIPVERALLFLQTHFAGAHIDPLYMVQPSALALMRQSHVPVLAVGPASGG